MTSRTQSAPQTLLAAEALLAKMRDALQGTELWRSLTLNHNEHRGPGTEAAQLRLAADSRQPDDWSSRFLEQFWRRHETSAVASFFVSQEEAPGFLTLTTFNRLALYRDLPLLVRALDGLPVAFDDIELSWTWDHENCQPNGDATHLTRFVVTVQLHAAKPLDTRAWLKTAFTHVCRSEDERADACVFQLQTQARIAQSRRAHSYTRLRDGFLLEFDSRKAAEATVEKLFSDCHAKYGPTRRHEPQQVWVTFSDCRGAPATLVA